MSLNQHFVSDPKAAECCWASTPFKFGEQRNVVEPESISDRRAKECSWARTPFQIGEQWNIFEPALRFWDRRAAECRWASTTFEIGELWHIVEPVRRLRLNNSGMSLNQLNCHEMWTSLFCYLVVCLDEWQTMQPWSVWSKLFALTCLIQHWRFETEGKYAICFFELSSGIDPLTLTTRCANSADDKLMIFVLFFFLQKPGFDISCKLSPGDNLHEMSKPVSEKNPKNISICRLLKILLRVLSVKNYPITVISFM